MKAPFSVSLARMIKEFSLESVFMPGDPETLYISSAEVNRPGIQFAGNFEHFDCDRIQIIGNSEMDFLAQFNDETLSARVSEFMSKRPAAVIVTRSLDISEVVREAAKENAVPLLRTDDTTSIFMSAVIAFLNVHLAPRITRHGVLVEVYGEGLLMLGESGVGKSETAVELIKRGHRLIADDAVEIRRVSSKTLVGTAPENIRHFVELRGIGIINARRIFGMGAVKLTEKIDMVINLEQWDSEKVYDRMGLDSEMTKILGLDIPSLTIPVKPGRNLAIIIEVAAMNNRQKKMGYNAAQELLHKLGMDDDASVPGEVKVEWENY